MVKQVFKILAVTICGVGGYILTDVAWTIPDIPVWLKGLLSDLGVCLYVGALAFGLIDLIRRLLGKSSL